MSNAAGPHRNGAATGSSGATPLPVETERELDDYLESFSRALVTFGAEWCRPCREMEPTVVDVAESVDAPVITVDVEELPQITVRYDVTSIPTCLVFESGEVIDRLVGTQDRSALRAALE